MKDLNQLLLNFNLKQNYKDEDYYVSKSNFYAYNLINKWPHWGKNILNIHGEKYSGKTHLSNVFLKKFKGKIISANKFDDQNLKSFKIIENLILDDFNEMIDERLIYSLFNIADQDNKYIIVNSLIPISEINFR